jgi:hypothetical protein
MEWIPQAERSNSSNLYHCHARNNFFYFSEIAQQIGLFDVVNQTVFLTFVVFVSTSGNIATQV